MKIKYLKLAVILLIASLFYGCGDLIETNDTNIRYVYYYIIDDSSLSWDGLRNLYSYNLNKEETKEIAKSNLAYITGISKSGAFVFQNDLYGPYSWIYSSDGTRLPISILKTQDIKKFYEPVLYPGPQLGYDNNQIVYFVSDTNFSQIGIPWIGKFKLLFLDNPQSITKIVELYDVCKSQINDTCIYGIAPFGDYFSISNVDSKVWFLMSGYHIEGTLDREDVAKYAYYIFEYSNGLVTLKCNTLPNPIINILGIDYLNEKIFVAKSISNDTIVFAFDKYNDLINIDIPYKNFSNPEQFAKEKSEMVGWTDEGIAIYDLNTMTVKQTVINWSRIDTLFTGLKHQKNKRLSFSPDAEYISFALPLKYSNYNYDLFVIKRDGSEFKRVLKNAPVGTPVVSSVIQ